MRRHTSSREVVGNKKIKYVIDTLIEISRNNAKVEYKDDVSSILRF